MCVETLTGVLFWFSDLLGKPFRAACFPFETLSGLFLFSFGPLIDILAFCEFSFGPLIVLAFCEFSFGPLIVSFHSDQLL